MSKQLRTYYPIFAAILLALHFFTYAEGQEIEARIEIRGEHPSLAYVSGSFPKPAGSRTLSFIRSVAGFDRLGERIRDLKLTAENGSDVTYQSVAGEFVSDAPFARWSYSIDLSPRKEPASAAHVSWISSDGGLLMLGDILPLTGSSDKATSAKVIISLPSDWRQLESRVGDTVITGDAANEVVAVGKKLRYRTVRLGGTTINIGIDGEWLFSSEDVANFSQQIFGRLTETFGTPHGNEVFINVFRFPQPVPNGQWQAETRGRAVTIISSDMPFKTQSLQRLHEQLRHEMFHLWIPNAVNLSGNYDWFYEGFALYSSLKLAVAENRIRFEDFLDTLSRAHAIDSRQSNRISLVDASRNRRNGNETYLYARGMFTGFLCDLAMLNGSKGKRSVGDLVREVYIAHRSPAARTDGTEAVLKIMGSRPELSNLIEKYISGSARFGADNELGLAGLELSNGLRVQAKLNGKQKDLLDALGYNNWRRLSR